MLREKNAETNKVKFSPGNEVWAMQKLLTTKTIFQTYLALSPLNIKQISWRKILYLWKYNGNRLHMCLLSASPTNK